jgi:hypothetical protein
VAAELDAAAIAQYAEACAAADMATCWHEGSHCIVAIALGRTVEHCQAAVEGQSHASFVTEPVGEDATIMTILAGPIGGHMFRRRILPPSREEILYFVDKMRGSEPYSCDLCKMAWFLHSYYKTATDDELVDRWLTYWRLTAALLDTGYARGVLGRLAAALQEKRHLSGAEVHQIVGDGHELKLQWALDVTARARAAEQSSSE